MLVIEPLTPTVRFASSNFDWSPRHVSQSAVFFNIRKSRGKSCVGGYGYGYGYGIKASAKEQPSSGPYKQNAKPQRYHPFEDISESELDDNGESRLTPAETTRTIIEVNSKATLMFSGLINEEVHENIFWPDFPYVTDEHGSRMPLPCSDFPRFMFIIRLEGLWVRVGKYSIFLLLLASLKGHFIFYCFCSWLISHLMFFPDIYFQVKNDQDILQALSSGENMVQIIIGLDTEEMLREMEELGHTELDFNIDELDDEDSDVEEDSDDEDNDSEDAEDDGSFGEDWVSIVDNEDDHDEDSDGSLGDWAKLDTMRSSHPMYFARKISEVASDDPVDVMDQPPAGLAIQGFLRPAFLEENAVIQKHVSDDHSSNINTNQTWNSEGHNEDDLFLHINGYNHEKESTEEGSSQGEDLEKGETLSNGTSFYKLEMAKIQLISSIGLQTFNCLTVQSFVEIEDFKRARPDAIAHSADNIIARVKAGGEKTTQALKSLCWKCKGIQVEEVTLIGVDSLGFDLRVCSGIQVQTLRFSFNKRASSEYSAERQLNYLMFPRMNKQPQQKKEAQQSES